MSDVSKKIAKEFSLQTQAETLMVPRKRSSLFIGIPKERRFQETRVALTPSAVELLHHHGHRVVIESKAGEMGHFTDQQYSEAGAEITSDIKKVYQSHIILKVTPPIAEEMELLQPGQIIFSPLHLPTLKADIVQSLMNKKVTAIAYEYLRDEIGAYPIVRAISEIAGSAALLIAAEYLSTANGGRGLLLGGISGIPPTKVIILGAGIVGENVARSAIGLGAEVKVFDNIIYKLMRLQHNIGQRVYTSVINPTLLRKELAEADVVIGAIHSGSGRSPMIVTEEMVSEMKPGAVIIDVSIDQGGCFATSDVTTHNRPTFKKYDVIHYCVPNIPARFAETGSYAFSNVLTPLLQRSAKYGGLESYLQKSAGTRHGVYLYKGLLTNENLSRTMGFKYTDLDLIITAGL